MSSSLFLSSSIWSRYGLIASLKALVKGSGVGSMPAVIGLWDRTSPELIGPRGVALYP